MPKLPCHLSRITTVLSAATLLCGVSAEMALSAEVPPAPAARPPELSTPAPPPLAPPLPPAFPVSEAVPSPAAPAAPAPDEPPPGFVRAPRLDWDSGAGKSYLIPAIEVPTFLVLLNLFDRVAYPNDREDGKRTYYSTFSSTWEHLHRQNWEFDKDPFNVNQFAHPYQGATMYGLARSTGLGFWESWGYSNVGSFLWKMAGETTKPSINDMITTGNAGSLLGEALFRMAGLVLEKDDPPTAGEELGAALISPPLGVNRFVFGDRFQPVFPSGRPVHFWQARFGESLNARINGISTFDSLRKSAAFDFMMSYGLPGEPGYHYRRPLDYFDFRASLLAETHNAVENVMLRGLLVGKEYQAGDEYRGVWGLYGSYDYISPFEFRVSTTALSLGTTGQLRIAPGVVLQESVLGGVGFGAAGTTPDPAVGRDYHYGVTPQGILDLRFIFGERALVDLGVREYYVTGAGSDDSQGTERIFRGNAGVTIRVWKNHGVGLQYIASIRNAHYGNRPDLEASDGTFSLFYTFLGDRTLGAVRWWD
ncbi:DUF3943 domain-containing protein [Geomesophilobacter sediminis]|uniref:DUF3943 domain-containing protein n=1 Tax=Geomesophilobacter sediminis TaxID=2798584 RepID=A0A8J7JDN3_9BACT|nr:DUF3943 domain-containing protein [Geomesophilobacter sediminis]MBJ6723774.1 DUF3943 domain-containing protein [Geomesophilobacter sediminis]